MNKRPNIVMIVADQMNGRHAGCYGHSLIRTPHIDRLASQGVQFNTAYCQAPLCMPSRASFNTGMYPHACGVRYNPSVLSEQFPTLAEVLSHAGYRTGGFGHIGGEGLERGFSDKVDLPDEPLKSAWAQEQEFVLRGGGKTADYFADIPISAAQTFDGLVAQAAAEFLDRAAGSSQPFFLQVNFYRPHPPCTLPKYFPDRYGSEQIALPDSWSDELSGKPENLSATRKAVGLENATREQLQQALAYYYGNISFVDMLVGNIVKALECSGKGEETLIIFTADHGDHAGAFGIIGKTGHFYDSLVRVPLIVSGLPHTIEKGTRIDHPVGLVDLFPTIVDACALGDCIGRQEFPVPQLQGDSFWSLCTNLYPTDSPFTAERPVFSEHGGIPGSGPAHGYPEAMLIPEPTDPYSTGPVSHHVQGVMIRKGFLKLSLYSDGMRELYDLNADPEERENLAGSKEYRDAAAELSEKLLLWQIRTGRPDRFQYPLPYHYQAFWKEALPAPFQKLRRQYDSRAK